MASATKRLEIKLLGRFRVFADGSAVQIESRKRRALLAYVAMHPGFAETRERLAGLLWGDRFDRQARQSLRQSLVSLRRELATGGDHILIDGEAVGVRPENVDVDVRKFLKLAGSDDADERRQAASLYDGEFLAGVAFDGLAFDEWLSEQRRITNETAQRLFRRLATDAVAAGDGIDAMRWTQRLVAIDPLDESGQRLLLQIEARYRGRDAALARASALRDLLRKELDASPEPETAALIAELKRGRGSENPGNEADGEKARASGQPVRAEAAHTTSRTAHRSALHWALAGVVAIVLAGAIGTYLGTDARVPIQAPLTSQARASIDPSWRSPTIATLADSGATMTPAGHYALIVLPFTTEAGGRSPEQALADQISDDLINDLSRVPALRVISRATSRTYRDRSLDVAMLGAELGVRYVIEGDVRVQDSQMRINVALSDAKTRLQVWSERFESERSGRFDVQDNIVRAIGRHLQVNVLLEEGRRRPPASDPTVRDLAAKGWAAMLRISQSGITSGADTYFKQALERDPDNGSALLGKGAWNVSVVAMFLVPEPEPHLGEAEPALRRVIELNPSSSLAYYFLGILHKTRGEPNAALKAFRKVLEINPSYAPAYAQLGHVLSRIGGLEEALEHVRYAVRISPKDPNLGLWSLFGGQIALEQGRDELAMEWLARAVDLDPRSPFAHATLAAAFALRGDAGKSATHAAEVVRLAPWLTKQRMMERLVGLSAEGSQPKRLYEGLRIAFADLG